jgi:hypothetical protein
MELALSLTNLSLGGLVRATRPTLPDDGIAISSWRVAGAASSIWFTCFLDATLAATINGPGGAGQPELYMYRADRAKWSLIGLLGKGAPIVFAAAGMSWAESLQFVGLGDRLAIVAVPTAGVVTGSAEPVETHGGF